MSKIVITGGNRLSGEISVSGAKNAAVAMIPATILANDICIIENIPHIEDVLNLIGVMEQIGAKCQFLDKNRLQIDTRNMNTYVATYESMKKIRASYYFLGAFLGRFKNAEVSFPGGCNFGERPIDQHIRGFEMLGAKIETNRGMIIASADKLTGATIYFDVVSVGTTINIMLASVLAEGTTIIENAAKEPHVVDTANFLNSMGAQIKGAGTDIIRIKGVTKLHGSEYMIIPDQIEAGTFMMAAAITGGDVKVSNIIPKHMDSISAKLIEMGANITEYDDAIRVQVDEPLTSVNIKTMAYPGFPTDLQPQMTALLSVCSGVGIITENVWENRFQYVNELRRLGAMIKVEGRVAVVEGGRRLSGAEVSATDLRAGAAMIVAALAANGNTTIGNVKYIDRGYEDIELKLIQIGAKIERTDSED